MVSVGAPATTNRPFSPTATPNSPAPSEALSFAISVTVPFDSRENKYAEPSFVPAVTATISPPTATDAPNPALAFPSEASSSASSLFCAPGDCACVEKDAHNIRDNIHGSNLMENLAFRSVGRAESTGTKSTTFRSSLYPASQGLESFYGGKSGDVRPLQKRMEMGPSCFLLDYYLSAAGAFAAGENVGCPGGRGSDFRGAVCGLIAANVFVDRPEG